MEEHTEDMCVRGYHVYHTVWSAVIGETLECIREPSNVKDRYAVAILKDDVIVGHLPRKFSLVCSLFLRQGGTVKCTVTNGHRYSADLPQGGLEIPCLVTFKPNIEKLKRSLCRILHD